MKIKAYECTNCNFEEDVYFNDSEEAPIELPCPDCEYNIEMPEGANLCRNEHKWNGKLPSKAEFRKQNKGV